MGAGSKTKKAGKTVDVAKKDTLVPGIIKINGPADLNNVGPVIRSSLDALRIDSKKQLYEFINRGAFVPNVPAMAPAASGTDNYPNPFFNTGDNLTTSEYPLNTYGIPYGSEQKQNGTTSQTAKKDDGKKANNKETKKDEGKLLPAGVAPKDIKAIKTPDGGYLPIPADAVVELYGVKEIKQPGNITVSVDADSAKSFTIGSDKYIANFDDKGKFTGYVLEKDIKTPFVADPILYQNKVDDKFKNKLLQVTYDLGQDPNKLMAVMAQETGETFSPKIKNETTVVKTVGKGKAAKKVKTKHVVAIGLIQFTQKALTQINKENKTNYTLESVSKMNEEEQLDLVEKYYSGRSLKNKSLKTIEDYAVANFAPANVGKGEDNVVYKKGSKEYKKNASLDANKDGNITNAEVGAAYKKKYVKK